MAQTRNSEGKDDLTRFGYHDRVAHIDLTTRSWSVEEPGPHVWRLYGGGGLLAARYLMRDTPAGLDAFDPGNLLILASSVMAGQPYPGLARFTAAAKSPLTGGIGEARCEGSFGVGLKSSGFDAIVIRGRSPAPVFVVVENGEIAFRDAHELWGREISRTFSDLESEYGAETVGAVIGPAGERLVRFASIVTNRGVQAARMGLGAVMGSKQLKAVLIRPGDLPAVADEERCAALAGSYERRMHDNPLTEWQHEPPGFAAWVHVHGTDAALCTRNYRDSVFAQAGNYAPERFMPRFQGNLPCPGCPNNCIKLFGGAAEAGESPAAGSAIHQEITGAIGSNLALPSIDDVLDINILCNEYGLDPTSLGFTLSMVMDCIEQGILNLPEGEPDLRFGDAVAVREMIARIAHRKGFGDVLAEGSRRAAALIGPEAEACALQIKGQEMTPFEPRTQTNLALGFAVAPVGPRYDICEHDWDYDTEVGWPHTMTGSRTLGILDRVPMGHLGPEKVRNFKALNTIWSAADALDLCIFAIAPTRIFSISEMAELLSAVTGWECSSHELMRLGERRNHLMRAYNLREGVTSEQDCLPDRFFDDPIPEGAWSGTRLDRAGFSEVIGTYYAMMGWNEQGIPRYETLLDHHLEWVVEEGHLVRI